MVFSTEGWHAHMFLVKQKTDLSRFEFGWCNFFDTETAQNTAHRIQTEP